MATSLLPQNKIKTIRAIENYENLLKLVNK